MARLVPPRPSSSSAAAIMAVSLSLAGCATQPSPVQDPASEPASAPISEPPSSPSAAASGGVEAFSPGGLDAGTRYVIDQLGISLQPDVDGWFAVTTQGNDVAISREDVTLYLMVPQTVQSPDGSAVVPVSADVEAFVDAIDATGQIVVHASEPYDANDLSGLNVELTSTGGSADNVLLTTASGEYGLADGEAQWIVLDVGGTPLVVSIERPSDSDIDAAWEIAGPLVESIEPAP